MKPIKEKFRKWKVQAQDFLDENLDDILFWSISILIAMFCCLLFGMLVHYQRGYPR